MGDGEYEAREESLEVDCVVVGCSSYKGVRPSSVRSYTVRSKGVFTSCVNEFPNIISLIEMVLWIIFLCYHMERNLYLMISVINVI